jgi:hypothetical protein
MSLPFSAGRPKSIVMLPDPALSSALPRPPWAKTGTAISAQSIPQQIQLTTFFVMSVFSFGNWMDIER